MCVYLGHRVLHFFFSVFLLSVFYSHYRFISFRVRHRVFYQPFVIKPPPSGGKKKISQCASSLVWSLIMGVSALTGVISSCSLMFSLTANFLCRDFSVHRLVFVGVHQIHQSVSESEGMTTCLFVFLALATVTRLSVVALLLYLPYGDVQNELQH